MKKLKNLSPSGKIANEELGIVDSEQSNYAITSNLEETRKRSADGKSVSSNAVEIKSNTTTVADSENQVCTSALKRKKKNRSKRRKKCEVDTNTENSKECTDQFCTSENKTEENVSESQIDVDNDINDQNEESKSHENTSDDHNETEQTKKCPKRPKIKKKKLHNVPRPIKEGAEITSSFNNKAEKAKNYLQSWNNDRNAWKFEKLTQLWLIKNMLNENLVSDEDFKILLEYMKDMKGQIRNTACDLCRNTIIKMENIENREENENLVYNRAQSALLYVQ